MQDKVKSVCSVVTRWRIVESRKKDGIICSAILTPAASKSKSKSRKKSKNKTGTKGASSKKDGEAGKAGAAKKSKKTVRPHIDNTMACAYIRKIGGTCSFFLSQESLSLWREVEDCNVHILDPFWLYSLDNLEADFLSHQALVAWDFQLSRRVF